ncbi:MAG: TetR/AcrR family transcriptional regulator [Myxococcales bacterium]|nr:TetR/AcrR family transcriptional regulator [Myxococcales bacterium]
MTRPSKKLAPQSVGPAATPTATPRRRPGRPPVISSDALLAFAREVFLEKGIRATTGDVAARAGVAEGTLFHRFGSKDALFRAAMQFDPARTPVALANIAERAGKGELRATLIEVGTGMLAIGRVALPVMMMSWSNPAGDYSLDKLGARPSGYKRAVLNLRGFFAREIELGRLTSHHAPEALARIFIGSLHHFCMTELFLPGVSGFALTPDQFVTELVDVLLHGAAPRTSSSL